jgi:adenylosuccinate lyase
MDLLETISPIDGRYRRYAEKLAEFFSEKALIQHNIIVESEYLIALSENQEIDLRDFSQQEKDLLRKLSNLSTEDARIVKDIEVKGFKTIPPTNHDIKAVEYFIKDKLAATSLKDCLEWIHFGLTSEDTKNIAYGLMLSNAIGEIIIPVLEEVHKKIEEFAEKNQNVPMLARTHGQPASPTTFGKEFKVFSSRIKKQLDQLKDFEISVKLNGATGNYNAHYAAYPEVNWLKFSREFVERFNQNRKIRLKPSFITTQIEPHDTYAELFDNIRRINVILIGFNQDMWRYISDDWIKQKPVEGDVGSSTMPHKVNPIDFENSEGNLGIANALFGFFSTKLPISRLQRDLSDSTVERNFGVALAHCLIAYNSILKGLNKITVNENKVIQELEKHPEVVAEAIQTILRREGFLMPYEKLKELTRGKELKADDIANFVESLDIPDRVKEELQRVTPKNYTGIAQILTEIE